ncbi:uncharacterized protein L201_000296 [Kwoniella dendrophila CBS 6074]|uniref:Required for respiratory growth protein 9, mitochondrial n=1 Tax=Kwoniella dendrophila CBS 6074 TaxID=1295534 RepID=A0AAX4JKP2_9TREE
MFMALTPSSSRIPISKSRVVKCTFCRSPFTTTSTVQVKRPQKPYEAPTAKIDTYGNRISTDYQNSYLSSKNSNKNEKAELNRIKFLESLSEHKTKSNFEKYGNGNYKNFGMIKKRSNQNDYNDNNDDDVTFKNGQNSIENNTQFDNLFEGDWKDRIGIKGNNYNNHNNNGSVRIQLGRKKFDRASENYLEEAKKLNPYLNNGGLFASKMLNSDRKKKSFNSEPNANIGSERDIGFSSEPRFSRRNDIPQDRETDYQRPQQYRRDRRYNEKDGNENDSKLYIKTPKKSFGLSSLSDSRSSPRPSRFNDNDNNSNYHDTTHSGSSVNPTSDSNAITIKSPSEYWRPTKKLTYSAMAGLKTLYSIDSEKYSKAFLSQKFGISYEAVSRILKSKYRDKNQSGSSSVLGIEELLENKDNNDMDHVDKNLKGTKWDRNPNTSENISPVPTILRAFGRE